MMKAAILLGAVMAMSVLTESAVSKQCYGKLPDGIADDVYILSDSALEVRIATYGGTVLSLKTVDSKGNVGDVVLGFDSLEGNLQKTNPFFGVLVARYANRIAHGEFTLEGKKYSVPKNDGENSLHG